MAFNNAQSAFPGFIVGSAATSFMKTAQNLSEPAAIVQSAVLKNTFVDVSSLDAQGKRVTNSITKSIKYADIIAFPLVGGALVIGNEVMVTIYGQAYDGTGIILLATSLAFLFNIHVNILSETLHAISRPRLVAFSNMIVSIIFLPVLLGVLFIYDTVYAILPVIVIARAFESAILYIIVGKEIEETVFHLSPIVKKTIGASVMVAIVATVKRIVPINSLPDLSLIVLLGAFVYAIVLLVIDTESRRFVRTYI